VATVHAEQAAGERVRPRPAWIFNTRADLLVAFCWIPIFLVAHRYSVGRGAADDLMLNRLLAGAFLLSLLHQPLTLALVYGDREQFALRRKLFTWSPPIAIALVAVAVILNLWIVIPIAAIWNTIHTLQQRYGLSRIYDRKAGYGSPRVDRGVLFSWMAVALLAAGSAGSTASQLARVMLSGTNREAIRTLISARAVTLPLLVPALAVAAWFTAALVRQEWIHRQEANRAKWLYQGSSLILIGAIALDPAAGLIAYVAAHAIEYMVVVYQTVARRYREPRERMPLLGRITSTRTGRIGFFATFLVAVFVLDAQVGRVLPTNGYNIALFSIGMLHFWYDSFIWKLRRPAVAQTFGIAQARG
jgi:hypothetical protein